MSEKPAPPASTGYQRALGDSVCAVVIWLSLSFLLVMVHEASWIAKGSGILAGGVVPVLAATSIMRRKPVFSGPADRITLLRAILTGAVATIVVMSSIGAAPARSWWIVLIGGTVLLLDGVDGAVARRTHTATDAGARLDLETDAVHVLVLSIPVAQVVGWWALVIGAMRYGFVAASWFRASLRGPLAHSDFRRVIGLMQGLVLCLALMPVVPIGVATGMTAMSLVLLVFSFGKDVLALER